MKKDKTKTVVDWSRFDDMIARELQRHREFIQSEIGQFLANGDPHYGDDWPCVCWRNPAYDKLEIYNAQDMEAAQAIIDFYHFSRANTKVILCGNGEDVTSRIKFDPRYHYTFVI